MNSGRLSVNHDLMGLMGESRGLVGSAKSIRQVIEMTRDMFILYRHLEYGLNHPGGACKVQEDFVVGPTRLERGHRGHIVTINSYVFSSVTIGHERLNDDGNICRFDLSDVFKGESTGAI